MKIAVIGDLHLGHSLYGYDLTDYAKRAVYEFLNFCTVQKVQHAIILGDIFDKPKASIELEKFITQIANHFEARRINLYALIGNHDCIGRKDVGSTVEAIRSINFDYVSIVDYPTAYRLPGYLISLLLLPFASPKYFEDPAEYAKAAITVFNTIPRNHQIIVATHLNIKGAKMGKQEFLYRGDDYVIPEEIIKSRRVTRIIAGHIHTPQQLGKITVLGSADPQGFSEAGDRYFALINEAGSIRRFKRTGLSMQEIVIDVAGKPSTIEDVKSYLKCNQGQLVKIQPIIDEACSVDWARAEEMLYKRGAAFVHVAPPIFKIPATANDVKDHVGVKRSQKTEIDLAKKFILDRTKEPDHRDRLIGKFREILNIAQQAS